MERVRKVSIVFRRGKHVVDFRDRYGARHRDSFDSLKEAKGHRDLVIAKMKGEVFKAPIVLAEKSVKESMNQYRKFVEGKRIGQTALNERYAFDELFIYLNNEHRVHFVHEISAFHLEAFIASQLARKLKGSTINRKCNSYRAWLNKCVTWGSIAKNPMDDVDRLDEDPPDIKTWSSEQVACAVKAVPDWLKGIILFLDQTGRRPIDAARAKFGDVDETSRTIKVKSYKGGKTRLIYVPLTNEVFEMLMLKKASAKREFRARDEDLIFLNAKKKPVTTNAIGIALRKAGIRDVTSYGLRHSFANGLVDDGVQARDIQLLMGHAKFETTTRYTKRDPGNLRNLAQQRAENRKLKKVL